MPVFVSPEGNREIWEEKPYGYFSEDEWYELHPEEKPVVGNVFTEEEIYEQKCKGVQNYVRTRLELTDFVMLPDAPFTEEQVEEVKAYRQALRDINKLEGYPWDGSPVYSWGPEEETTVPLPQLPSFLEGKLQ